MTFQRRNPVELQALLDECPKCGMPAGTWCKTRYDKFSDALHADRTASGTPQVSIAELQAQMRRDTDHAAQRAAINSPEGMAP